MQYSFTYNKPFNLESGITLNKFHLSYEIVGEMNGQKSNIVWVFHALTANSNVLNWWSGLVGENCIITPHKYCIICVNIPGSCYGSFSPLSLNNSGEKYYHNFPLFTTIDTANAYQLLANHLQINSIFLAIGGSLGGQQLLSWAVQQPGLFKHIIPIATNAYHSQWGIAFNESQRWAIEIDVTWQNKTDDAGLQGLKLARSIAMLSYRNYGTYNKKNSDNLKNGATYQRHQGEKLSKRFNAFSYYFLTKTMDSHNVGKGFKSAQIALQKITSKALIIGIDSDILFPVKEQKFISKNIRNSKLSIIKSPYGHDGFLIEVTKLAQEIQSFIKL